MTNRPRITKEYLETSANIVRYMGHPLRFRILEYIHINGETNVSTLIDAMGECQVSISQSLKRLRRDGLVHDKRDGKFIYYSLNHLAFPRLINCIRRNYYLEHMGKLYEDDMPNDPLPVEFVNHVSEKINFMGHPMRYKIAEFLYANGPSSVSDIMKDVDAEQVPVSLHLKKMKAAGMVICQRKGHFMYYELASELPVELIECMYRNNAPTI